jgi:hypothetical protein
MALAHSVHARRRCSLFWEISKMSLREAMAAVFSIVY